MLSAPALSAHLLLAAVHLRPRPTAHGLSSSARPTPACHRRPSHSRHRWSSPSPPPTYRHTVTLVGCLSSIVFAHAGRACLYVAVISVSTNAVDVHRARNAVVVALYSRVVVPIVLVISRSYFRSLFTLSARRLIRVVSIHIAVHTVDVALCCRVIVLYRRPTISSFDYTVAVLSTLPCSSFKLGLEYANPVPCKDAPRGERIARQLLLASVCAPSILKLKRRFYPELCYSLSFVRSHLHTPAPSSSTISPASVGASSCYNSPAVPPPPPVSAARLASQLTVQKALSKSIYIAAIVGTC